MSVADGSRSWHVNSGARIWQSPSIDGPREFHRSLTGYAETPLVEASGLAAEVGVGRLLVKDESSRMGLPAFKILGASYAIARALSEHLGSSGALSFDELTTLLGERPNLRLVTATDGNHGRAVARVARQLGLRATIVHPDDVTAATVDAIRAEGADTIRLDGSYDEAVERAATLAGPDSILVQDTSWPGYTRIPQWIVDGYTTLCAEIDDQLEAAGISAADLIVVPAGVGSLAQAVTAHYRSGVQAPAILIVEPEAAPAVTTALKLGQPVRLDTRHTVMTGLNCGTVSDLAWPVLRDGADGALIVTDEEAASAVARLAAAGIDSGPCGAATLAGLTAARRVPDLVAALGLRPDSVVVLLNTESLAANPLPMETGR